MEWMTNQRSFVLIRTFALTCLFCIGSIVPRADAQPKISSIDVRALEIGQTTRLIIKGSQLDAETRIVSPLPISSQTVVDARSDSRLTIDVHVADDAPVGTQAIRLLNARGISSPEIVSVDRIRNLPFSPQVKSLPVALSGVVRGAQILKCEFAGTAGDPFVAEVYGKRGGSSIRPVLRLYSPAGRQLRWSQPQRRLDSDTRLEKRLPENGIYTLELHDVLYQAPSDSYFRLKIGNLHHADLAFPLAIQANHDATVTLPGSNLSSGRTASFRATSESGWHRLAFDESDLYLTTTPLVRVEEFKIVNESSFDEFADESAPAQRLGINGKLSVEGEVDRFPIKVAAGAQLNVSMIAAKIGSPIDGYVRLVDLQGNLLAENDDPPNSSDPSLDFVVPDKMETVMLEISDITGAGGDDYIYLIQMSDRTLPDFQLLADRNTINLPAMGTGYLRIDAERKHYNGPIKLKLVGLPADCRIAGDTIPAGGKTNLLTITAGSTPISNHVLSIVGKAEIESKKSGKTNSVEHRSVEFVRNAQWRTSETITRVPWLQKRFGFAYTPEPDVQPEVAGQLPASLPLGGEVSMPIRIRKSENFKGKIRLRLETNQTMPKKKTREDNQDKIVDDLERALRLANPIELDAATLASSMVVTPRMLIPNDLPERDWAFTIVAEKLSADGGRILQETCLPTISLSAIRAFKIRLTSGRRIELEEGSTAASITGKVERLGDFAEPVAVTLTGLPESVVAPKVIVPPNETEFVLPIELPADIQQDQIKGVGVVGHALDATDSSRVLASSNRVRLSIVLRKTEMKN